MGEHEGLLLSGGLLTNEAGNVCRVLDGERWVKAEERTAELIDCIQPNRPSEERRNAVVNYVQRLVMKCFSCEVFTFGSVPLKTYLPDGDIDLTAFSKDENLKDTWANEVRQVLENEERDANAEFRVKEVQYIQAEVKIIKCLVENIVVDISFNQVGGLCTLCFLEEIDNLINQNHLFKRSIILIKAWCYYESRILGAHHGLISTYALETLVLYIFHVFNNSFAGPLEVLYRFLEFFSNFDWENFCVSLWGPVPINSLPNMTAEPPRKDGGELLLGKLFLQACSEVYAVLPSGQENLGQQFVSKYFNVIDPLRTNNNLGRSVSKGNFYRIRSAFSFGAKKLTNLLDCPKENLIAEVNLFFMNTLQRRASGKRPDAPASSIPYLLLSNGPVKELDNSVCTFSLKKNSGSSGVQFAHEHQSEGECACHASHFLNTITQPSQHAYKTSKSSTVSHTLSQKSRANQSNSRETDHLDRITKSSVSIQPDKNKKNSRPDFSVSDQGSSRFQFARTQSSPELAGTFTDAVTRMRHNRVVEAGKTRNEHSGSCGSRRKTMATEAPNVQNTRLPFHNPSTLKQSSSHKSIDVATVSHKMSNICHDDSVFTAMEEEISSASEALELRQLEEQDLINMMASSQIHNFDGQFQLPMQVASPHLSFPLPPIVASMGYAERNMAGIVPTNITLIDPSWVSGLQLRQGFAPSTLPHYFPNTMVNLNSEESKSATDNSGVAEMSSEDGDPWHDHDIRATGGFKIANGGSKMLHSDERKHSSASGYNYLPSSRGNISGTPVTRGNHKIAADNRGFRDDYPDLFQHRTRKANEITYSGRNSNLRFVPMTQGSSSGIKPFSETSRDVLSSKVSKSRDKWGRRPSVSAVTTSSHGEASNRWQFEGLSEHVSSSQEDDGSGDWELISTAVAKKADRTLGPATSASSRGADSVVPVAPMFVGGSGQRVVDNSRFFPFAFYPTGPPVPFLTMLPVYNFPADGRNSDSLINQINEDRGENHACPSENNFDSTESLNQSVGHMNHMNLGTSNGEASKPSEELKLDILDSDFASHWQNLQYGRFCQNTPNHESLVCPPLMVPPVYLQGHFPLDGPGRPPTSNVNVFTHSMGYDPRLAPITSLQPGTYRPSSVFHRYGEEPRRYRGGTGTYLPNPKAPYRDRHFSNTRNHRGSYNHDRGDHNDREGSWINSKARSSGRSHGRNHRSAATDGRPEGVWDSYRHDQVAPLQAQNSSFGSSTSSLKSANVAYGMHPLPGISSNGVGPSGSGLPSVVMLYPYEQGVSYGSSAESLELGALGPVHLSINEVARPGDGNPSRRFYDQRHAAKYGGGPPRSSPDQPSSPQILR